jgi:hypothetical protein
MQKINKDEKMEENSNQQISAPAFEVIECIEKDGWKIVYLRDSSDIVYAHTVGLYEKFNFPELLTLDCSLHDAHKLFSIIVDKCIDVATPLENVRRYQNILESGVICTLFLNDDLLEMNDSDSEYIYNFNRNSNSKFYEGINPNAEIACLLIRDTYKDTFLQLESLNKLFDLNINLKYGKAIENGSSIHVY